MRIQKSILTFLCTLSLSLSASAGPAPNEANWKQVNASIPGFSGTVSGWRTDTGTFRAGRGSYLFTDAKMTWYWDGAEHDGSDLKDFCDAGYYYNDSKDLRITLKTKANPWPAYQQGVLEIATAPVPLKTNDQNLKFSDLSAAVLSSDSGLGIEADRTHIETVVNSRIRSDDFLRGDTVEFDLSRYPKGACLLREGIYSITVDIRLVGDSGIKARNDFLTRAELSTMSVRLQERQILTANPMVMNILKIGEEFYNVKSSSLTQATEEKAHALVWGLLNGEGKLRATTEASLQSLSDSLADFKYSNMTTGLTVTVRVKP